MPLHLLLALTALESLSPIVTSEWILRCLQSLLVNRTVSVTQCAMYYLAIIIFIRFQHILNTSKTVYKMIILEICALTGCSPGRFVGSELKELDVCTISWPDVV